MNNYFKIIIITVVMGLISCTSGKETIKSGRADYQKAAQINVELAVGYMKRNQMEAAQDKLEKAIEQDHKNIEAYKMMALLQSKLGEDSKAEEYYENALDINPNDPGLHNSYGTFLCKLDRIDEAIEEFKKAYRHPFYETPYLALSNAGSCLINKPDYEQAEMLLRKALETQPRLAGALISMADIGIKTKRYLMARAYIQRYHEVSKPTAESLWIQIQAEKALGAKDHYMKYAKQLMKEFPDSHEAGWLEEQAINERNRSR